jgi:hypothetical protein
VAVLPRRRREEVEEAAAVVEEEGEDEDPEGDATAEREARVVEACLAIGPRETSLATRSLPSVRAMLLAGFNM